MTTINLTNVDSKEKKAIERFLVCGFKDIKSLALNPNFIPNISKLAVKYLSQVLCKSTSSELIISILLKA